MTAAPPPRRRSGRSRGPIRPVIARHLRLRRSGASRRAAPDSPRDRARLGGETHPSAVDLRVERPGRGRRAAPGGLAHNRAARCRQRFTRVPYRQGNAEGLPSGRPCGSPPTHGRRPGSGVHAPARGTAPRTAALSMRGRTRSSPSVTYRIGIFQSGMPSSSDDDRPAPERVNTGGGTVQRDEEARIAAGEAAGRRVTAHRPAVLTRSAAGWRRCAS